jgi:hypothetical protein
MNISKDREGNYSFANRSRYIESVEFQLDSTAISDFSVVQEIIALSKKIQPGEGSPSAGDYKRLRTETAWIDFCRFTSRGDINASLRNFMNRIERVLQDPNTRVYIRQFEEDEVDDDEGLEEPDYYEIIVICKQRAYKLTLNKYL